MCHTDTRFIFYIFLKGTDAHMHQQACTRMATQHCFLINLIFLEQFQDHRKIEKVVQRFPMYSFPFHMHGLHHCQYPAPEWCICYSGRTHTDTSLLLKAHSLHQGQWCDIFYWFAQSYNNLHPPLWFHTECFHCLKNPPCSTYSSLSPIPLFISVPETPNLW